METTSQKKRGNERREGWGKVERFGDAVVGGVLVEMRICNV